MNIEYILKKYVSCKTLKEWKKFINQQAKGEEKMKKLLKSKGYSVLAIAREYGCSRQFVDKVLRGEKAIPEKLAALLSEKIGIEKNDFIYQYCYCKKTSYFLGE